MERLQNSRVGGKQFFLITLYIHICDAAIAWRGRKASHISRASRLGSYTSLFDPVVSVAAVTKCHQQQEKWGGRVTDSCSIRRHVSPTSVAGRTSLMWSILITRNLLTSEHLSNPGDDESDPSGGHKVDLVLATENGKHSAAVRRSSISICKRYLDILEKN